MKVYTYSQARQELAKLLEEARIDGEVGIKKRDGQTFILKSVIKKGSPLDIEGVNLGIKLEELNEAVRESREQG
jgi:hypothetical protein